MIKLLIVNEDMELGGAQRMAVVLANAMAKNHEITVAFAASHGPLRKELDSRVSFHEIPTFGSGKTIDILGRLRGIISDLEPGIIHSHGATVGVLSGMAGLSARTRAVRILTHHSQVPRRLPRFAANLLFRGCFDHLVAISRHKYDDLISGGLPREMVSLIPNFVCVEHDWDRAAVRKELGIAEGNAVVSMAGRLIKSKRFDLFIDVLAAASRKTRGPITGLVIGDGPESKNLQLLAQKAEGRVDLRLLGYQKEVARFLSITDVFLFPSAHPEVLPMALIEASSMGVPIVCSDIPGNHEVVTNGANGFLVSGGAEAYCARLISLLEDESGAKGMSQNAKRMANERFSEGKVTANLVSMYRRLLARN